MPAVRRAEWSAGFDGAGAPSEVTQKQLDELHIALVTEEKH